MLIPAVIVERAANTPETVTTPVPLNEREWWRGVPNRRGIEFCVGRTAVGYAASSSFVQLIGVRAATVV